MPQIHSNSIGETVTVSLFVHRDFMARPSCCWRLLWAESADSDTFCHAEGECSARHFPTMRAAVAYGEKRYNETARRFIDPREG